MTEDNLRQELYKIDFHPLRMHLASGKTIDVLRQNSAMPLADALLIFRKMAKNGQGAEGYDVIAYDSIERIEQLDIGKSPNGKRKSAS